MSGCPLIVTITFSQHKSIGSFLVRLKPLYNMVINRPERCNEHDFLYLGRVRIIPQLTFLNGLAHFGQRVGFVTRLLSHAWPQFPQIQVLSGRDSKTLCLIF